MSGITFLDIGILILFLYFSIGGYNKGFIKQTSTIAGIILALLIAINYYDDFIPYVEPYVSVSEQMLQFISFAVLFILVNIFIHILGIVLKNIMNLLFLEPIDHAAGAALGLLKGGLLAYFLVLILKQVPYPGLEVQIDSSLLAPRLLNLTPLLQHSLQMIFRP